MFYWYRKAQGKQVGPVGIGAPWNTGGEELVPDEYHEGYVRGYRWWRVGTDMTGMALQSLHFGYTWKGDNTAGCLGVKRHKTKSPDPACACGLYAQRPEFPIREWERLGRGSVHASGSILMSGRIIICERGYKAEKALIEAPVIIEAACMWGCEETPAWITPPKFSERTFAVDCATHVIDETDAIPVDTWLRECVRQLTNRYGFPFISPLLLEEI